MEWLRLEHIHGNLTLELPNDQCKRARDTLAVAEPVLHTTPAHFVITLDRLLPQDEPGFDSTICDLLAFIRNAFATRM